MTQSFDTSEHLDAGGETWQIQRISTLPGVETLPYSIKILLENLLRHEDGETVTREDIESLLRWDPSQEKPREIAFRPARVLMQDFTGVPAVVDLAAMRDAMQRLGGDPDRINPLQPAELVIDHSVQVDSFGSEMSIRTNSDLEFSRNRERYAFLKWGQNAFSNFKVVPPDTGIVHQVNLEYLARVVFTQDRDGVKEAFPDTVVGTDSHTTMINGIGVLGWGVGGIEAEASMLGQPISMLIPRVVGVRIEGRLPEGATATDLVLRIVEMLREHGVVGKFVEFFGPGLDHLPLADRATIANMAPEYGATCGIFPIDVETLRYLRLSARPESQIALVETYARTQGMWRDDDTPEATYSEVLELDLSQVEPALAGPRRPQDRMPLRRSAEMFRDALQSLKQDRGITGKGPVRVEINGKPVEIGDGAVVIAAITSCTNTSNPSVMMGAGLLAKKAAERGLGVKPWVKTSLAPGSKVVTGYLEHAGVMDSLRSLGFNVVGYGCTTCIGNSGPLPPPVSDAIRKGDLSVASVLSGNRNFEGRVHAEVRMNFLASPPLVVAYAIAGRMDIDLYNEPLGQDVDGNPVYLRDIWPGHDEVSAAIGQAVTRGQFSESYRNVFSGDAHWAELASGSERLYGWGDSTYVNNPPYFDGMTLEPAPMSDIRGARVLALLGDSVTTDHISPAGAIKADSPAGIYLQERGIAPKDFNSYGSRRGNHEVMMRGTFANIRLRNLMAPGTEGGVTKYQPSGELMSIYDAAMRYQSEGTPTLLIAGREYGSGSSRDWAAKGPRLLGVRAVIAESYERIHRSNLVGMGILPLQFREGDDAESLGLTGLETFDIEGLEAGSGAEVEVAVTGTTGDSRRFTARVRIDTPQEVAYYRNGGILQYVLRQLAA
ncbi:MAG: aconitate hydratase AcnA [Gammaproteobacteria bacterium]|jgi:aconitate hydratase|nr:aconitate hydratase AcnA [Gammaproteobacteria bacterium]